MDNYFPEVDASVVRPLLEPGDNKFLEQGALAYRSRSLKLNFAMLQLAYVAARKHCLWH